MANRSGAFGLMKAGAASVLAMAAAACATAPSSDADYASSDDRYAPHDERYASARYPGADRIYRNGYVQDTRPLSSAHLPPGDVTARTLAAYDGIEGARLAHRLYNTAQAERLDGACERVVRLSHGETLYDVSQLCDVPVYMLMDYNPSVVAPRHVREGQWIEVPQLFNQDRFAYAAQAGIINVAATYVVQPGDSLSKIASSHLTAADALANLNPGVNWRTLQVGETIRIPASAPGYAVAPGAPRVKPISSYLGDGDFGGKGDRRRDRTRYSELEKVMPYKAGPVGAQRRDGGSNAELLSVSQSFVKPGDVVWVSASGLPANADVTISRGSNRGDLEEVETVRTGPDGALDARVRVGRSADMGGVVITATVDETGQTLYSERVGVLELEGDTDDFDYYFEEDEYAE